MTVSAVLDLKNYGSNLNRFRVITVYIKILHVHITGKMLPGKELLQWNEEVSKLDINIAVNKNEIGEPIGK